MRVPVIVRVGHRNHAAVRNFTNFMFELDRRMVDMEVVRETLIHAAQNGLTLRGA